MTSRAASKTIGNAAWLAVPVSLEEWEELLRAVSNSAGVGLCILDTDFRYVAINNTMAEMNGVPVQAHLGKSVRQVLGDFAELIGPQLAAVLRTGQAVLNREISALLPSRTEAGHWLEHYVPIRDSSGQVAQIGVVAVEITEQKKIEESFRSVSEKLQAEKKRGQVMTEIGRLLAEKWDVREVFPKVSAYLRRVLRQEYAALSLRDEKSGELVRQAIDFPLGRAHGFEISAPKDPGGKALKQRTPLIFSKDEMRGLDSKAAKHFLTEGLQSLCCVPLIRPKGPLGVLVLGSTRAEAFHTDDLALLDHVAAQLAIAIENSRIAREIELLKSKFGKEKENLQGQSRSRPHIEGIIGESAALTNVLGQVTVVADSDATVLLLGETGTGKGIIARAIHGAASARTGTSLP